MLSIGIYGGTFNPIHIGHLIAADEVLNLFQLDKIIFIPVGIPPHKDNNIAPAKNRYEMIKLAINGNRKFEVSDIEIKREGYTYTYDTLMELKSIYSKDKLHFIIGYDAFKESDTWKMADKVYEMVSFIVVNRGGFDIKMHEDIEYKKRKYNADVKYVKIPDIEISSTDIRLRISKGLNYRYMLPEAVFNYIIKNELYRGEKLEGI
ncbi:nicotinate-nucleotide adenylyltransferase [Caloramator quimbayensis]|uniref:Probable nicotinate-nucleotide adenylyltransferase n=1 Tax=Caloramator quimbayensis TaxID=1147123 RepID=A0A1T4XYL3_9CLOT|nr:nicotinate-nucleotide adenylyltransferase [Caloramator quimbayensis]SKA94640.1 nicotinate-nucleotide adenylyltransferase [Caloramator quimbayensis]